eukprot:COSAG02_NODE_7767_length_2856_cov_1.846572_2_plen_503_part_00
MHARSRGRGAHQRLAAMGGSQGRLVLPGVAAVVGVPGARMGQRPAVLWMPLLALLGVAALLPVHTEAEVPPLPPFRISTCAGGSCPSGSANAQLIWRHAGGAPFIPRGVNFIRLSANIGGADGPGHPGYHSTFSPKYYPGNRTAYIAALDDLHSHGYNLLRVFIDPGGWTRFDGINGNSSDEPLSQAYLKNLADFISLASARGLYVNPTLDATPLNPHFTSQCGGSGCDGKCGGYPNNQLMDEKCVAAKAQYVKLFLAGVQSFLPAGAAGMSGIAWISLYNEATFSTKTKPFSMANGSITTGDGGTYDLANATQRQLAADSNALNNIKASVAAAKSVDPEVLVACGVFTFQAVGHENGPAGLPIGTKDDRFPLRPASLTSAASALDLLDVHVYQNPGWGGSMAVDLASSERDRGAFSEKPVVMGEFGAWRKNPAVWPSGVAAAAGMVQQQVDSCKYNFSGSMFWTYDTMEQPRLWNMRSAPEIFASLSPKVRPDPCRTDQPN